MTLRPASRISFRATGRQQLDAVRRQRRSEFEET